MPLSRTQGKEITIKTRKGQNIKIEMGRAYLIDDPNNALGPLTAISPPQLTDILFIPIGVDRDREYKIRALFISVDSHGYVFNKRDDYNVCVISNDCEVVLNYNSILEIFDLVEKAENKNIVKYNGTKVAVNPWEVNTPKFVDLIPTEIKLFDASRIPKKFLKYFFVYPHYDIEVVKGSQIPPYAEVTSGISSRINNERKKAIMLEKFYALFAMLNVNTAAKLPKDAGNNYLRSVIPIIPFIRKEAAQGRDGIVQEVAIASNALGVLFSMTPDVLLPDKQCINLRFVLSREEYELIGMSSDILTSCGVVFHINGEQYATVPQSVYEGNPQHRSDVARINLRAFNVIDDRGNSIEEFRVEDASTYVIKSSPETRQYIHYSVGRWAEQGEKSIVGHQIVDFSDGFGYSTDEALDMAEKNAERKRHHHQEEILNRVEEDEDGEDEEYPEPYQEDEQPEPEGEEEIDQINLELGGLRVNIPREELYAERGSIIIRGNYNIISHGRHFYNQGLMGTGRAPIDPERPLFRVYTSVLHNSRRDQVLSTILEADFNNVTNTVDVSNEAVTTALFKIECDDEQNDSIKLIGRSFPSCIFVFHNVSVAMFSEGRVRIEPNAENHSNLSFILVPRLIAENENICRVVEEIEGVWLGRTRVEFQNIVTLRSFNGRAVLLPENSQHIGDLLTTVDMVRRYF